MISPKGAVLLCIDEVHPIVSSVARWNPGAMIRRELGERSEIPLPPFVSSVVISGSAKEFTSLAAGFRKAITDERIPSSVRVLVQVIVERERQRLCCTVHSRTQKP